MRYSQNCLGKHMTIKTILFATLILASVAFSQERLKPPVDSISIIKEDSTDSIETASATDSLFKTKNTVAADSLNTEKPVAKLTKRDYNHREQMIFGTAMMAFLAIILTTVQSMNPD
jgi:hypothetical protein